VSDSADMGKLPPRWTNLFCNLIEVVVTMLVAVWTSGSISFIDEQHILGAEAFPLDSVSTCSARMSRQDAATPFVVDFVMWSHLFVSSGSRARSRCDQPYAWLLVDKRGIYYLIS